MKLKLSLAQGTSAKKEVLLYMTSEKRLVDLKYQIEAAKANPRSFRDANTNEVFTFVYNKKNSVSERHSAESILTNLQLHLGKIVEFGKGQGIAKALSIIEETCKTSTSTSGTCSLDESSPITCEMNKPLDLAFYLDTSINIQRINLDHYFYIIENILRNFAFMHQEYKFKGQLRNHQK